MRVIGLFEELLHLAPGRLTDLYRSDCGASMLSLRLIKYAAGKVKLKHDGTTEVKSNLLKHGWSRGEIGS